MYWIDINLLNDREEFASDFGPPPLQIQDSKAPMAIGLGIGAAAIALVFGAYSLTGFFNQKLASEEQELDQKISKLGPQIADVERLQNEIKTIQTQTDSLAKIFSQIKPWSAMLSDLRDRVPSTLQIAKITQTTAGGGTPPAGEQKEGATPPSSSGANSNLSLSGSALSFGDVNDFVLTLRQSSFLNPDGNQTKLTSAKRKDSKDSVSLVEYQIETQVNNAPAESLLAALRENGASGLVSRIETLKRQGVIKQ